MVDRRGLPSLVLLSSPSTFMVSHNLWFNIHLQVWLTWTVSPLGFVYDIYDGQIYDLNVSQGPPGYVADNSKCKRNLIAASRHGRSPSAVEGC